MAPVIVPYPLIPIPILHYSAYGHHKDLKPTSVITHYNENENSIPKAKATPLSEASDSLPTASTGHTLIGRVSELDSNTLVKGDIKPDNTVGELAALVAIFLIGAIALNIVRLITQRRAKGRKERRSKLKEVRRWCQGGILNRLKVAIVRKDVGDLGQDEREMESQSEEMLAVQSRSTNRIDTLRGSWSASRSCEVLELLLVDWDRSVDQLEESMSEGMIELETVAEIKLCSDEGDALRPIVTV